MPAPASPQPPSTSAVGTHHGGSLVTENGLRTLAHHHFGHLPGPGPHRYTDNRSLLPLEPDEALALLATVDYGRVVFTERALPAIRPVNHLIDNGDIIIRTRLHAKISHTVTADEQTVVAYEADQLDPQRRLGWSVVVTGFARPVVDQADLKRLQALLVPWVHMTMDTVIAIRPEIISGYRLIES